MPVIVLTLPYDLTVEYISTVFNLHSLEMQIIWLLELLVARYYNLFPNKFSANKQSANISLRDLNDLYEGISSNSNYNSSNSFIRELCNFRNNYVHRGPVVAKLYYDSLVSKYDTNLNNLAESFSLKLNWDFCLYNSYPEDTKRYIEDNKETVRKYVIKK